MRLPASLLVYARRLLGSTVLDDFGRPVPQRGLVVPFSWRIVGQIMRGNLSTHPTLTPREAADQPSPSAPATLASAASMDPLTGAGSITLSMTLAGAASLAPLTSSGALDITIGGLVNSAVSGDNAATLQAAFNAAAPGTTLRIPAGIYRCSTNLNIDTLNLTVEGAGSGLTQILMTVETLASWRVYANGHTLRGLEIKANGTVRGSQSQAGDCTLLLDGVVNRGGGVGCSGFVGEDLILTGARSTGFFAYGATLYTLRNVFSRDSKADSFHSTQGSTYGKFYDCRAENGGDDMMAFVSYGGTSPAEFMEVYRFTGKNNTGGRGIACIDTRNIYVEDFYIEGSRAAGVFVASETATGGSSNMVNIVMGKSASGSCRLVKCNIGAEDHGAVCSVNGGTVSISGVALADFEIVDTGLGRSGGPPSANTRAIAYGSTMVASWLRFKFYGTDAGTFNGANVGGTQTVTRTGWDTTASGTQPPWLP